MNEFIDEPKLLGKDAARVARHGQLKEPHIVPLTQFVERLRQANPHIQGTHVPYFDPWDGGVEAEVLFLQEAPGPRAVKSGFISCNNPDETAKNFFEICHAAGIPRKRIVRWNVVPWYIGDGTRIRAATCTDVKAGLAPLFELLSLLTKLRGVVLLGKKAEMVTPTLRARYPDLRIFVTPHPSPLFCNRIPGNRDRIISGLLEVSRFLGLDPSETGTLNSTRAVPSHAPVVPIKLAHALVELAKAGAAIGRRSVSEQIERWARLGKLAEDNPELPFSFLKDMLQAIDEANAGHTSAYHASC